MKTSTTPELPPFLTSLTSYLAGCAMTCILILGAVLVQGSRQPPALNPPAAPGSIYVYETKKFEVAGFPGKYLHVVTVDYLCESEQEAQEIISKLRYLSRDFMGVR